jgi:hypothetical protein
VELKMASTATDLTIEHYQRPEVREAIFRFCQLDALGLAGSPMGIMVGTSATATTRSD